LLRLTYRQQERLIAITKYTLWRSNSSATSGAIYNRYSLSTGRKYASVSSAPITAPYTNLGTPGTTRGTVYTPGNAAIEHLEKK
jgi:hypothetical protein